MKQVSFKRAAKIIDISPSIMTDQHVMLNFESLVNSGTNPEGVDHRTLIQAKLILLSRCYEHQVREKEKFTVTCPYDEPCKECGGTGAKFKWYKADRTKKCRCDHGKVNLGKCYACNGSGRYVKEDHGLRLKLKCKKCGGSGERIVTCKFCHGKGRKEFLVLAPKVESFTICHTCKGFGYKPPQHIYNFNSPTIISVGSDRPSPNDLAHAIDENTSIEAASGAELLEIEKSLDDASQALIDAVFPPNEPKDLVESGHIDLDASDQSSAEAISAAPEEEHPSEPDPTPSDDSESSGEEASV